MCTSRVEPFAVMWGEATFDKRQIHQKSSCKIFCVSFKRTLLTRQGFCWEEVVQLLLELRLACRGEACGHLRKPSQRHFSILLKNLRSGMTFFPLFPSSLAPEIWPPFLGLSTQSQRQAVPLLSSRCAASQSQASPQPPVQPRAAANWATLSSSPCTERSTSRPPDSSHSDLASK